MAIVIKMKNKTRRSFLESTLKAGLILPLAAAGIVSCKEEKKEFLDILILGGTSFLGPHQIAYALKRGHKISTFTRGKTKPSVHAELLDQVENLIGDRENDLKALENRKWDVVIDNSGRNAQWTAATAKLLKRKADLYIYTSSTGVYYPYLGEDIKEDTELVLETPPNLQDEIVKMEYDYGVMKANSELAAIKEFGKERTLIIRPTYMIGPGDQTDRFIHWPIRLAKGGEVLVPGKVNDPVQYVDVRDVAEWMIRLAEGMEGGVYNAVGPKNRQFMQDFVEEAGTTFEVEHTFLKIPNDEFLIEREVLYIVPWIMPIENNYGSALISNQHAINNGLTFRPLTTSMIDIYRWWNSGVIDNERKDKVENDPKSILARESEIIKDWKELMNI